MFHIHDPKPADQLFAKSTRKSVTSRRAAGKAKDFRDYDFPEGDFPVDGAAVSESDFFGVWYQSVVAVHHASASVQYTYIAGCGCCCSWVEMVLVVNVIF